jgi:hypothetical protein
MRAWNLGSGLGEVDLVVGFRTSKIGGNMVLGGGGLHLEWEGETTYHEMVVSP